MELVKGVPITKYCDELHLPIRERLALFVPVCQAIQHAHQKGIIHRDIKPSNVLVCMQDGKPVPKVIDFGVAKALHQKLTEQTMYTEIGQIVGTLEYMSPEQAELSALDIDTRADVYALGVLLYELLTGTTPLDRKRLERRGVRGDAAADPRGGAAQAEHPADRIEGIAGQPGGAAADGAGAADEGGARRAGLDRDEVPGEGPDAALRDGERPGAGRRALSGRRAGGSLPADGTATGCASLSAGTVGRSWRRPWYCWRWSPGPRLRPGRRCGQRPPSEKRASCWGKLPKSTGRRRANVPRQAPPSKLHERRPGERLRSAASCSTTCSPARSWTRRFPKPRLFEEVLDQGGLGR